MNTKNIPYIGGHVSSAGGLWNAIQNGENIGAEAIQIYGASPRQWMASMPKESEIRKFKEARAKSSIKKVYLHAAYLVNLASSSDELYEKSVKNLSEHFSITEALGADGLIFHVGSSKDSSFDIVADKEVRGIKNVLKNVPGKAMLIMENSSGGGNKVGAGIEEMKYLYDKTGSTRLKICFDTAHAFEAGIIKEYTSSSVKKLFDEWDKAVDIKNIEVLHINDSKTAYGSHSDRHENIGKGQIGITGFKALVGDKRLFDKVWLLEVPGFDDTGPDKKNVDILRSLFI
ncbi:hypothetical protein A3I34_01485 [Candidatus Jorgensenbacteria bacterium RIFCSPLOWO2_02_FULL_45_12]|uniref:Probable endonuclease 4 n=2 Tax=Candidatus Joergenseniibacteriota TaxID=1752739 RepID=A0A1F6BP34_9BACT|nr:MAG: putative endonuclease 4 [Candidatus Jorgensenbacteria bacterium GW2011_GWA2_45_9]OGG38694.1 MAG: hypothetical protein A3D55_02355 [Candidatus Jorgensenbacteria bacterium RIFCSPHIGHO2_02_FULL_45_20]OGG42341.1 MAG: hypothetical protein A3I34_01485 [Candidatus Jorgensenbacteria bacterium RIFCSPLOWO2_02_FULL_45_12]